jgi:hypothetical protein
MYSDPYAPIDESVLAYHPLNPQRQTALQNAFGPPPTATGAPAAAAASLPPPPSGAGPTMPTAVNGPSPMATAAAGPIAGAAAGASGATGPGGTPGAGGGGNNLYTGTFGSTSTSGGQATTPSINAAFQNALQGLLTGPSPQQAGQQVMSSPAVTGYQLAQQRQEARDRAFAAERAAANGTSASGGFNTTLTGLHQQRGENVAQFAGQEAANAEKGRRQELLTALSLAQQMGDSAEARRIQWDLGLQQQGQFDAGLNFQAQDRQQFYNQQALQALFGGG